MMNAYIVLSDCIDAPISLYKSCENIHGTSPGTPAACSCTAAAAPLCAPSGSAQPLRSAGSSPDSHSWLWPPPCHLHRRTLPRSRTAWWTETQQNKQNKNSWSWADIYIICKLTDAGDVTWASGRGCGASAGVNVMSHLRCSIIGSGNLTSSSLSPSHKLGCVLTGGSISPHIFVIFLLYFYKLPTLFQFALNWQLPLANSYHTAS